MFESICVPWFFHSENAQQDLALLLLKLNVCASQAGKKLPSGNKDAPGIHPGDEAADYEDRKHQ